MRIGGEDLYRGLFEIFIQ